MTKHYYKSILSSSNHKKKSAVCLKLPWLFLFLFNWNFETASWTFCAYEILKYCPSYYEQAVITSLITCNHKQSHAIEWVRWNVLWHGCHTFLNYSYLSSNGYTFHFRTVLEIIIMLSFERHSSHSKDLATQSRNNNNIYLKISTNPVSPYVHLFAFSHFGL